ncbi:TPA: hypothetical protein HA265_06635 [Candidatus Woesearchaeota archaeon]|nr:hypothetical protein [Candidatus Woesearchaeota archaeon]
MNLLEELKREHMKAVEKTVKLEDMELSELKHRRQMADKYVVVMQDIRKRIPELSASVQELKSITRGKSILDKDMMERLGAAAENVEEHLMELFKRLDARNKNRDHLAKARMLIRHPFTDALEKGTVDSANHWIGEIERSTDKFIAGILDELGKGQELLEREIIPKLDQLIHEHEGILHRQEQSVEAAMDKLEKELLGKQS